ncbi:hypothetical protein SPRG_07282 [Saprolegnia parasitica CBS 223.65]|uniref:Uncharacterized protein n=1 Tax=Saprolegnia parasitica (strain CBS 223.65) TaxID=695850 RepID=A0A067CBW8_SAPPC|nr:hypothetical protein SPRG_07282 [Saprolegnia parasitica CBS 223.65]KDO28003.1 hypothetical protein SPRG_07282 [Saprolegnia parasitica CBS 223.65]|eukprot:XP_012201451.1 hypothetical protein SPRG_07282 [Saprolegnia parasitica CBS 223.65]
MHKVDRHRRVYTAAAARNLSPTAERHEEMQTTFGFGCNVDEHIKYGKCLDGQCMRRTGWEVEKLALGSQRFAEKDGALLHACATKNEFAVAHLLSLAPSLTPRNAQGQTALHVACAVGSCTMVERLLAYNASPACVAAIDLNVQDVHGNTCLHAAAAANALDIVQRLVAAGCTWSVTNHDGKVAADVAGSDQRIFSSYDSSHPRTISRTSSKHCTRGPLHCTRPATWHCATWRRGHCARGSSDSTHRSPSYASKQNPHDDVATRTTRDG